MPTYAGPDTEHAAVDREASLLALLPGQEIGHQGLAGVDEGLAGVVQEDDPHGQQQHPDGFGGHIRVQTLADVKQEEGEDKDDGEGEDEGSSAAVSAATAVRQLAKAGNCEESKEGGDSENDGHVGLRETNLNRR